MATSMVLYGDIFSTPTRLVTCTMELLGLKYEFKAVDIRRGENLTTSFQKMNPKQTVPMLLDGTFKLTESRAIAKYLLEQHGSRNSGSLVMPALPQDRARVDEMLFFDVSIISERFQDLMHPLLQGHPVNEIAQGKMMGVLHSLNKHLASASYMALPDSFTLADVAVFVVVSTIHASKVLDLTAYPHLNEWRKACQGLIPNYERANQRGLDKVVGFCSSRM